jgi:hypothetical protein
MHECKLPTIAGVDYVMSEVPGLIESLIRAGSETRKTELIHPAEVTKSVPEKGNIDVLAVDTPVEVAKYVPDLETCSGLSSLQIKDTAVSSPLFK